MIEVMEVQFSVSVLHALNDNIELTRKISAIFQISPSSTRKILREELEYFLYR